MRGVAPKFWRSHHRRADPGRGRHGRFGALVACATFPRRQLPDKSVSVLDTACARVAIGQTSATPAAVEDRRRKVDGIKNELSFRILRAREQKLGADPLEPPRWKSSRPRCSRGDGEGARCRLEERWKKEQPRSSRLMIRAYARRARGSPGEFERERRGGRGAVRRPDQEEAPGTHGARQAEEGTARSFRVESPLVHALR